MFKLALITFIFFGAMAKGATARPKPVVEKTRGQPVLAIWPNGDTAELRWNRNSNLRVSVPFQVTENQCNGLTGARFNYVLSYREDRFRWVWTKHSNPAKVGTLVTTRNGMRIEQRVVLTNPAHLSYHDLNDGFEPDSLEIQEASWLPGGLQSDFTISSWFSEQMITNPEDGSSENRIVAEILGLHVVREDATHAHIPAVDASDVMRFRGSLITIGDVVTWVFEDQGCQISMKPDAGVKDQQVLRYEKQLSDDLVPFLWQQDTMTKLLGGDQAFIFSFVENADD